MSSALFLPSCARPIEEHHGRAGDVMAEQYGNRIEAVFPPGVDVPAARAAAEQTLRLRGYVVTETTGTEDRARIEASGTGDRRNQTSTIDIWRGNQGTRIRVDPGAFAEAAPARSMLDEIIARLGR